jgi:hypothetical protein
MSAQTRCDVRLLQGSPTQVAKVSAAYPQRLIRAESVCFVPLAAHRIIWTNIHRMIGTLRPVIRRDETVNRAANSTLPCKCRHGLVPYGSESLAGMFGHKERNREATGEVIVFIFSCLKNLIRRLTHLDPEILQFRP